MMPACNLKIEDLVAYRDGELDTDQSRLVEHHIPGCSACQERLATFAEVDMLLQSVQLPEHTPEKTTARLRLVLEQGQHPRIQYQRLVIWWTGGAFLVMLLLVVLVFIL